MLPKGASPDEGTPLVKVSSIPGHVYCGSLCSARHFVKHWAEHPKQNLLDLGELGLAEVVLLIRSRVFRASMGSTAAVGPNPRKAFQACLGPLCRALRDCSWRLPSLAQCEAAAAKVECCGNKGKA